MLCHVLTTPGRKDLTIYRCPGFRMSYSDQVQRTFSALRRPPPISSLLRNSIFAQSPRWAHEDMLLFMLFGELSSSRYTVTGSPAERMSCVWTLLLLLEFVCTKYRTRIHKTGWALWLQSYNTSTFMIIVFDANATKKTVEHNHNIKHHMTQPIIIIQSKAWWERGK